MTEIPPLDGVDKRTFLRIKRDYEKQYPVLHVSENPYEMMNDFLREISIYDIKLKQSDLDEIKAIVSRSGTSVDLLHVQSIARHVEDFLRETAF